MKSNYAKFAVLAIASALLLSAGFLFPHCGGFSLIGFVPLLWMDRLASREKTPHFFWWYYLSFVLWNAFTTFWVCNATFAGGLAAILINAFLFSVIWTFFRLFKRRFTGTLPYIFLPLAWIAWERFYFMAEVSWPWLTLGNAFASSITCVQWYEVLGTLGGSLWIWVCNLSVFGLMVAFDGGYWQRWNKNAKMAVVVGSLLVFLGPLTASWIRYVTYKETVNEGTIATTILQPNFDPYQKFVRMSRSEQNAVAKDMISKRLATADALDPILFVAPETFTDDIVLNTLKDSPTIKEMKAQLAGYPNANLVMGASSYELFYSPQAPSYTARRMGKQGPWYESHNSALMLDASPRIEIFHKSRLVIGTEKMPWPRLFSKVDDWLGGNVIARCTGQEKVSLLNFICNAGCSRKDSSYLSNVPLGCAICYESVYPEYFTNFIATGAKFMTVITNDAWWGDTPGYRQHLRYSCLRAIETRRDIARSANTGISAFINQRGDIVSCTEWNVRTTLDGTVNLNSTFTPFVRLGDVTGRLCTFFFLLMMFALCINILMKR